MQDVTQQGRNAQVDKHGMVLAMRLLASPHWLKSKFKLRLCICFKPLDTFRG